MKISVKMTAKDLYDFSMYNSYSGFMGLFNLIFTVGALFLLVFGWGITNGYQKVLLVCCALIFTVLQPLMLQSKSKKQSEQIGFSAAINLTMTDEKIAVEQAGVEGDLLWEQIWKVIRIKSMYILKVGPTHGYLIPNRTVEGREKELEEVLRRNLPPEKLKSLDKKQRGFNLR